MAQEATDAVKQSEVQLGKFQAGLLGFAKSLSSCYTEYDSAHAVVRDLRSKVARNTALYRELHLKASKRFIQDLHVFMSNYTACDLEIFVKTIDGIAEEAAKYQEQAALVAELHNHLYTDSHALVDEAKRAELSLQVELKQLANDKEYLDDKADRHGAKAVRGSVATAALAAPSIILAPFTSGVSLLGLAPAMGTAFYAGHHNKKETKTTYKSNAVDVSTANAILAAKEIGGPMAESLRQFSTAITLAAQFFSAIAEEVRAYAATADLAAQLKSRSLAEDATWKLHRHYQRMSAPALALERTCAAFLAVVPQIEADLQRLASSDATHIPYIQKWLKEREDELKLIDALDRADEEMNGWHLIKSWCPSIFPEAESVVPPSFSMDLMMDNLHGTGPLVRELSLQQMVNTAETFSESASCKRADERELSKELSGGFKVLGVNLGSKGMAKFKKALESEQQSSRGGQQFVQQALNQSVRLEAPAGTACKYRVTARSSPEGVDSLSVKAIKLASVPDKALAG